MLNATIRSVGAAALAAAMVGCGGHDDTMEEAPPASSVSAVIGPQGGTVSGPDGVRVVVPSGALPQPTMIGIARNSAGAPAAPTGNPAVGSAYEFTPHDLVFNKPVTLRMPVPWRAFGPRFSGARPIARDVGPTPV